MKIYTRSGDGGETGLFGGGRVPKDHLRVAAYGAVDEVNAAIGFARALEPAGLADALLQGVQRDLFAIGGQLASPDPGKVARALAKAALDPGRVAALEAAIDAAEASLPPLEAFVIPGGSPKAAALHVARTVCRRAERGVVALGREASLPPGILPYLNRLSDLLFVLARSANAAAGRPDVAW
ncbi:MAG TPA: cob(I)yrinic acid a,c-diamide adenosyltransferase [Gemmatimonadales bacterium]|nr:cob(I)yrinic acid a,c-diamide adenosyltransferase [Gemmatimonadales bacterium]